MDKNDETVANHWVEEIKAGLKYRKKYSSYSTWNDNRKYYRGEWDDGVLPVNRVFSFGRAMIPQVSFHAPRVVITATRPEFVPHARVLEAIDNALIRKTFLKRTLKTTALTSYLCGTGPIKLGYDSEFGFDPEQAIGEDFETATQEAKKEGRSIEYKSHVQPGTPWALPVQPDDIVVPYGYKNSTDLPWIAHRFYRPVDDIKQDSKYANTDGLEGGNLVTIEDDVHKHNRYYKSQNVNMCELWEIRDVRDGRIITLCEGKIILSDIDVLQFNRRLPFEFLTFNEDPEHFWGIPDISMIIEQQKELNEIRTQAKRHRQIALLKFLVQKGVMKEEEYKRFLSGEVGPMVEIEAESLAASVMMLQPHIPPEFQGLSMEVKNDMQETLGFDSNQLAGFKSGTPPTAQETSEVAQNYGLRVGERRDLVADMMTNIIKTWNEMIFRFWSKERVIDIVGPMGQSKWISFTGEQLQAEYDLRIDPESGLPISRPLKIQTAEQILKTMGGDPMVDQASLKRQYLEQFEWLFPGISSLLIQMDPALASATSQIRQPGPQGTGVNQPSGNRGGGQQAQAGKTTPFDKFKQQGGSKGE